MIELIYNFKKEKKMKTKIDYKKMAIKNNLSESKIRKMEKQEPEKFRLLIEVENAGKKAKEEEDIVFDIVDIDGEEEIDSETKKILNNVKLYAMFSLKGGSGKSTLGDMLASYIRDIEKEEVVILNLDNGQIASDINSCETIDYVTIEDKFSVLEILVRLAKKYKHIIIDTPGELSEEFLAIIHLVKNFILPFNPGMRNLKTAITTLKVYVGENSKFLEGKINLYIVLNNYQNDIIPIDEVKKLNKAIQDIEFNSDLELNIKYTGVKFSKTIKTIEGHKKSINDLYKENPGAYSNPRKKANIMCEKFLEMFNK